MKNFTLSVATVLALSTFAVAGGDIAPVEPAIEVPEIVEKSDSGFYIGGAYSSAHLDEDYTWAYADGTTSYTDIGTYEEDYDAIMLQAGYQFNQYFALEGRYWTSVGDGEWSDKWDRYDYQGAFDSSGTLSGGDIDFSAWGLYIKPMYPLTEELTVYGLLGYGNVTLSDGGYDWLDDEGFQWGAGASYAFTDHLSVFADYVNLHDDDHTRSWPAGNSGTINAQEDDTLYTINLGLTYRF